MDQALTVLLAGEGWQPEPDAWGRLTGPTYPAFDESRPVNDDALTAAIDDLLGRKPHLASRKPYGDVGQGARRAPRPSI